MKYQIIRTNRGFAIRNILDGCIEYKCKTHAEATRVLQQFNGR